MTKGTAKVLLWLGVPGAGFGLFLVRAATGTLYQADLALMGAGVVAAGALLIGIGLGSLIRWWAGVAVVLALAAVTTWKIHDASVRDDEEEAGYAAQRQLAIDLWPVCEGKPVPAAAAYDPSGRSPILVFTITADDHYARFGTGPHEPFLPKTVAETQLVACISEVRPDLPGCTYGDSSKLALMKRVQEAERVVVYEARTGKQLADQTITGGEPAACPDSIMANDSLDQGELRGTPVTTGMTFEVFRALIE